MDLAQLPIVQSGGRGGLFPSCVRQEAFRYINTSPDPNRATRIRDVQHALGLDNGVLMQWWTEDQGRRLAAASRADTPAKLRAIAEGLARNGHPAAEIQRFLIHYYSHLTNAAEIGVWVGSPATTPTPPASPQPPLSTAQLLQQAHDRSALRTAGTATSDPIDLLDLARLPFLRNRSTRDKCPICLPHEAMSFADKHPGNAKALASLVNVAVYTFKKWCRERPRIKCPTGADRGRRHEAEAIVTELARDHHPLEQIQAFAQTYYAAWAHEVGRWFQNAPATPISPPAVPEDPIHLQTAKLLEEANDRSIFRTSAGTAPPLPIDLLDLTRISLIRDRPPRTQCPKCLGYEAAAFARRRPGNIGAIAMLVKVTTATLGNWCKTYQTHNSAVNATPDISRFAKLRAEAKAICTELARDHHPIESIQAFAQTHYAAWTSPHEVERWVGAQPQAPRSPAASVETVRPGLPRAPSPQPALPPFAARLLQDSGSPPTLSNPTLDPLNFLAPVGDGPLPELPLAELPPALAPAAPTHGFWPAPTSLSRSPSPDLEAFLSWETARQPDAHPGRSSDLARLQGVENPPIRVGAPPHRRPGSETAATASHPPSRDWLQAKQLLQEASERHAQRVAGRTAPARPIDLLDLARLNPIRSRPPRGPCPICLPTESASFMDRRPAAIEAVARLARVYPTTVRRWQATHRTNRDAAKPFSGGRSRAKLAAEAETIVAALARDHHSLASIQAFARTHYAAWATPADVERWVQTAGEPTNSPTPAPERPAPPPSPGRLVETVRPVPLHATSPQPASPPFAARPLQDVGSPSILSGPPRDPLHLLGPLGDGPLPELPPLSPERPSAASKEFPRVPTSPSPSPSPDLDEFLDAPGTAREPRTGIRSRTQWMPESKPPQHRRR